jgi:ATP-binding cassette subfamily C protein LapB
MMDQATEARVIDVLGRWLTGRTLVLSTHRLQLLAWVERAAVIENGRLLLEGPREDILKQLSTGVPKKPAAARQTRAAASTRAEAAVPQGTTPSAV